MPMRFNRVPMPMLAKPLPMIAIRGAAAGGFVDMREDLRGGAGSAEKPISLPARRASSERGIGAACSGAGIPPAAGIVVFAPIHTAPVVPVVRPLTEIDVAVVVAAGAAAPRFVVDD